MATLTSPVAAKRIPHCHEALGYADEVLSPLSVASSFHPGDKEELLLREEVNRTSTTESPLSREPVATAVKKNGSPWPARGSHSSQTTMTQRQPKVQRAATPTPFIQHPHSLHLNTTCVHRVAPPRDISDCPLDQPAASTCQAGDVLDLNKYKVCLSSPEHHRRSQSARSARSAQHSRTTSMVEMDSHHYRRLSSTHSQGEVLDGSTTASGHFRIATPTIPEVTDGEVPSPLTPRHHQQQHQYTPHQPQDTMLSSTNAENEKLRADLALALRRISALESQSLPKQPQPQGHPVTTTDQHQPRGVSQPGGSFVRDVPVCTQMAPNASDDTAAPFTASTASSVAKMQPKVHTANAVAVGNRAATPGPGRVAHHSRTSSTWSNNFTNERRLSTAVHRASPSRCPVQAPGQTNPVFRRVPSTTQPPMGPLPAMTAPPKKDGAWDSADPRHVRRPSVTAPRHPNSDPALLGKDSMISQWDANVGAAWAGSAEQVDHLPEQVLLVEDLRATSTGKGTPQVRHYYTPAGPPSSNLRSAPSTVPSKQLPVAIAVARRGVGPSKAKIVAGIEAFLTKEDSQRAPHAKTIAQALKFDVPLIRQKLAMDYGLPEKLLQRSYLL